MTPLLDTHQHLVIRDRMSYGWSESLPQIATGDFTADDYADLTRGKGVSATIFMETAVGEDEYQAEALFAHELASQPDSMIRGVIASIRPEIDDGFDLWLETSLDKGFAGFRRILHVVDNGVPQSETFRRNVRKIGAAGKPFDLCFTERQLPLAANLVKACGGVQFVLDHCGVPDIPGGSFDFWRSQISMLAELPNLVCKLSGIMAYCSPGKASYGAVKPYTDHVLETFGPERMLWGGDWPVVNTANGLADWISVTRRILERLSEDEAALIAHTTAEKIYGVTLA